MRILLCLLLATSFSYANDSKFAEKKQAFEQRMKMELENLDLKITELKQKAKDGSREDIRRLENERQRLSKDLEKLSQSSGKAWTELRKGFENAFKELKISFKKASDSF